MLTAISSNLDKPPVDRDLIFDMILMALYGVCVVIALFFAFTDQFWLNQVHLSSEGLKTIAAIKEIKGSIARKTTLDSIWLDLDQKKLIYSGDAIHSQPGSGLVLEMGSSLEVAIKENSKLKLQMLDATLQFRLTAGEVLISVLQDQNIAIQRGAQTEVTLLRKGSYTLKVDPAFGVQLEIAQPLPQPKSSVQLANRSDENRTTSKESQIKPDAKKPISESEDPASMNPESTALKIKLALPTPIENTIFFGSSAEDLVIAAQRTCSDACTLKIFKNHKLWKSATYNTAEEAIFRLPAKEFGIGLYDWVFTTETKEFRSRFTVKSFSDDEFSKAIEKDLPIEM